MTELRRAGRHAVAPSPAVGSPAVGSPAVGSPAVGSPAAQSPAGAEPDAAWVPPPFEPARPGDFVEYSSVGFEARRSRRGLVVLLCLLLVAAAGGSWWYLRHRSSSSEALTCQAVYESMPAPLQRYVRVTEGGTLPKGIPVPPGEPGRQCTASNRAGSGLMVVWPGVSESEYATLLQAGGWSSARAVAGYTLYLNGGDKRQVATTVVDGQLVAMYDR